MKTLSLCGPWSFAIRGDAALVAKEPMPAAVPGCNYHDLLRLGKIGDPFCGDNERKSFWVGEADFDYFRTFSLTEEDLTADRVELSCAMLDTLCRVYVNGILVGEGQNTHIAYAFDVTQAVRAGENILRIEFDSPVRYAKAMAKQFTTAGDLNFTGRTHIRKAQCHFGWDWGPRIPVSGITGDISLRFYTGARLLPMEIAQNHGNGGVTLHAKAEMEAFRPGTQLRLALLSPEGEILAQGDNELDTLIETPRLWWTHDLSGETEQPLYTVRAQALYHGEIVDIMERRIGLRTIELNREADAYGHNFQFVLNGVPLFAKGSNWIPPDAFPDRATVEVKRGYLEQCVRANMNMIRIWGGGYYETDEFYDLCDRMGLLVWQDFAFACAPYPFDRPDFLQNVQDEVACNVTRLRHHASLALWCGNNELECMAITWLPYRKLQRWSGKFFWGILPGWVKELDAHTPFISTSPTGGAFMQGPESDSEGDTHLWHVWHGLQPLRYYRRRLTRFCSEFGQQSLPSMEAVRSFAGGGELALSSPVLKSHQKCLAGNAKILYYMLSDYRLPKGFAETVYLSQLTQAQYVGYATELWRRHRGRCNGSLFWQLNDSWPAVTWSSIDHLGRAKALQYYARRFNAPLAISIDDDRGITKIYVLNDTREARELTLSWQLTGFDGTIMDAHDLPVNAMPLSSKIVSGMPQIRRDKRHLLRVQLKDGDEVLSERTLLFDKEKNLNLPRCEFTPDVEIRGGVAHITVRSDSFARAVFVESNLASGNFSENFVDMFPGEPVTLTVDANGASAADIQASLCFTTVGNIESHSPARCALERLRAFVVPAHFASWFMYKRRKKMP